MALLRCWGGVVIGIPLLLERFLMIRSSTLVLVTWLKAVSTRLQLRVSESDLDLFVLKQRGHWRPILSQVAGSHLLISQPTLPPRLSESTQLFQSATKASSSLLTWPFATHLPLQPFQMVQFPTCFQRWIHVPCQLSVLLLDFCFPLFSFSYTGSVSVIVVMMRLRVVASQDSMAEALSSSALRCSF